MKTQGRARAISYFVLCVLAGFTLRPLSVNGQILGTQESFVEAARSWASEADGLFYATCHIDHPPYPGYIQDAYLVMPRARLEAVLFLVTPSSAKKERMVVNVGTMEFHKGIPELADAPQSGMTPQGGGWTQDFLRRAAVAALRERLALTFSLAKIFDQQPSRNCRMPPEPDWPEPKK